MDPGEAEEGVPPPAGAPPRKRFVIPLEEDEAPPAGAKPLFRATRDFPAVETPAQPAPQTYAEYAISRPPAGAGALCPPGAEPPAGETPNQALKPGTKSNSIVVSPRQRGNPVLRFVRNVPWEFGEVLPDYVLGQSTCALFLSLRYHHLHPDYIHARLQSLGKSFALRILLVQVDVVSGLAPRGLPALGCAAGSLCPSHHQVKSVRRAGPAEEPVLLSDCSFPRPPPQPRFPSIHAASAPPSPRPPLPGRDPAPPRSSQWALPKVRVMPDGPAPLSHGSPVPREEFPPS